MLAIEAESVTPDELMTAILKAPVDLFWNGGIGTYVKAASARRRPKRRTGSTTRSASTAPSCAAGWWAKAAISAAPRRGGSSSRSKGGRINTDFIDNSAGVDCSDHEVNIKILLRAVVDAGELTMKQRDELLASMTDEVAELVLRDNVLQNLALEHDRGQLGLELLDAQIRLMRGSRREGRLDREVEHLPSDAELAERRKAGKGLTRPELAVLLAYAKMTLYEDLLRTELPDRAYLVARSRQILPASAAPPLREPRSRQHRLKREIVATWIANSVVNRGLAVFVSELEDETGGGLEDVAARLRHRPRRLRAAPGLGARSRRCRPPCRATCRRACWSRCATCGARHPLVHAPRAIGRSGCATRCPASSRAIETVMRPAWTRWSGRATRRDRLARRGRVRGGRASSRTLARTVAGPAGAAGRLRHRPHCPGGGRRGGRLLEAARVYFALDGALDLPWLEGLHPGHAAARALGSAGADRARGRPVLAPARTDQAAVAAGAAGDGPSGGAAQRRGAGSRRRCKASSATGRCWQELRQVPEPDLAMLSVAVRTLAELVPREAA